MKKKTLKSRIEPKPATRPGDHVIYAVLCLKERVELDLAGRRVELPLAWADGMIGAIPVFKTWKAAYKYGGEKYPVTVFQTSPKKKEVIANDS